MFIGLLVLLIFRSKSLLTSIFLVDRLIPHRLYIAKSVAKILCCMGGNGTLHLMYDGVELFLHKCCKEKGFRTYYKF